MKKVGVNAMMAAAMMMGATGGMEGSFGRHPDPSTDRLERECIRCGTPHRHNNAFCSAECCKAWRAEKRAG